MHLEKLDPVENRISLPIGAVLLTQIGKELASIVEVEYDDKIQDKAINWWVGNGFQISTSLENRCG
ncbi:hypothetical protein [Hymenobacter sp. B1770]|uniref:hypothetical protein n=1 Tax=Hymenobacter sp. B1770 TaxID=1718788 RepID=UPI003CF5D15A